MPSIHAGWMLCNIIDATQVNCYLPKNGVTIVKDEFLFLKYSEMITCGKYNF